MINIFLPEKKKSSVCYNFVWYNWWGGLLESLWEPLQFKTLLLRGKENSLSNGSHLPLVRACLTGVNGLHFCGATGSHGGVSRHMRPCLCEAHGQTGLSGRKRQEKLSCTGKISNIRSQENWRKNEKPELGSWKCQE